MSGRMSTYFVPGGGIDREVITTDICRYLGPDALVKPGTYADPNRPGAKPEAGFFVTAYRSLTTEQLADIKLDSARWKAEREKSRLPSAEYGNSATLRNRDQINPYPGGMQSGGYQSPAMNTGYNPTGGYNDQSRGPNYGGDPTYGGNQYGGYSTGQPVQFGIDQSKQNSAGRGMNTGSYGGYDPNYNNPSYPQQQYGGPTGGYDYSAPTGRGMPPPNPLGGGYMPNQQQDMYGANPPYRGTTNLGNDSMDCDYTSQLQTPYNDPNLSPQTQQLQGQSGQSGRTRETERDRRSRDDRNTTSSRKHGRH